MVEIFGTDVNSIKEAEILARLIKVTFSYEDVNFDLEDDERILRIKSENVNADVVIATLKELRVQCYRIE